jgi:hypothetical protein
MIKKLKDKEKAIKLRKRGFSYSEILKEVPVAKSTLSLWLRSVGLSERQKQRLTEKKLAAALRGAKTKKDQRLSITKEIKDKARSKIGKLSNRELLLIGTALYWAEGHKERNRGNLVKLGNSDPEMIKIFLEWLYKICKIEKKDLVFRIYLHETSKNRLKEVRKYWARAAGFPIKDFQKITWKKNKISTNRKNTGKDYYGLLDVGVRRSINLNRKIQGWIEGIYKHCGVV